MKLIKTNGLAISGSTSVSQTSHAETLASQPAGRFVAKDLVPSPGRETNIVRKREELLRSNQRGFAAAYRNVVALELAVKSGAADSEHSSRERFIAVEIGRAHV